MEAKEGHEAISYLEGYQEGEKVGGKKTAKDIGETLCVLAGNLMLEDKEAGSLLAQQLQAVIDYIKTKYLPELPKMQECQGIADELRQDGIRKVVEQLMEEGVDGLLVGEKWWEELKANAFKKKALGGE